MSGIKVNSLMCLMLRLTHLCDLVLRLTHLYGLMLRLTRLCGLVLRAHLCGLMLKLTNLCGLVWLWSVPCHPGDDHVFWDIRYHLHVSKLKEHNITPVGTYLVPSVRTFT